MIDFRSDTLTKPSKEMLEAMMSAKVGDDVFGEDPTVKELERKCADIFGMDSGIFCPSGTMTNQIALRTLTRPCEEIICYEGSHVYKYEGGGIAANSGCSVRLIAGDRGKITAKEVADSVNPEDAHYPISSVVSLENTVNKGGGSYYHLSEIEQIAKTATNHGLKMHLDGARIFNALVETGDRAQAYGSYFDTISVCLSKGLGAPVGSVLLLKKDHEKRARRIRKLFGGGMRQAGFLAAAGIYALDHNIDRLKDDHAQARKLADALKKKSWVESLSPVETNILIFKVREGLTSQKVMEKLKDSGILCVTFGPMEIRLVTHLDISNEQLDQAISIIERLEI